MRLEMFFLILLWIMLGCALLAAVILLISYICFRMAFYADRSIPIDENEFPIPEGEVYEPFREAMVAWMKEVRAMPHEDISIRSFDGLTLWGRYYEYAPGAPMELMFHGYRGRADRDLCGGVQRCFALGRNALIVDQRACGKSDGNVITFGVLEHRDCLAWLDYAVTRFGPDQKIILTGISMGASTVAMAAGQPLPENVIGVLADCGYSSAKAIIQKVTKDLKLPPKLCFPFIKLGAKVFGHFDLESDPPTQSLLRCKVPVIFFHGEDDDFVPCQMSREMYAVCPTKKKLVTIPNAGHGLSYLVDPDGYLEALAEFFGEPIVNG